MSMVDHEHLACSREHRTIADVLLGTPGHGWGCVAVFYAAYHYLKWALRRDPRFQDIETHKRIDGRLTPHDRFSHWHKARRGRTHTGFGINDLVELMYPEIASDYINLHEASLSVRYRAVSTWRGLPTKNQSLGALDHIESALAHLTLKHRPRS